MALHKQPLAHVFPGEEAPRKPDLPPNPIIKDPNLWVDLALVVAAMAAAAAVGLATALFF